MTRLVALLGTIAVLLAGCSSSSSARSPTPAVTRAAQTVAAAAATATVAPPAPAPTSPPVQQQATPSSGVTFVSVVGGPPNGTASVSVKTSPGASCSISYTTPAGTASKAQGLVPATANGDGIARWSWKIGSSTRPGAGTVTVSCAGVSASAPIRIG